MSAQRFSLHLLDISFTEYPQRKSKSLYLKATVGGSTGKNDPVNPQSSTGPYQWKGLSFLDFDHDLPIYLIVQIMSSTTLGKDKPICELASPIDLSDHLKLENHGQPKEMRLDMVNSNEKKKTAGTITFSLRLELTEGFLDTSFPKLLSPEVSMGARKIGSLNTMQKAIKATAGVGEVAEKIKDGYNDYQPLFGRLKKAIDLVDEIAAIYPYAQMAWTVLSPILKIFMLQNKRDQGISSLLDAINSAYDFVDYTSALKDLDAKDPRRKVMRQLCQQTCDCAWFIRQYITRGFVGRLVKSETSGHDQIVKSYIDAFIKLKKCFKEETWIATEIVIYRTLETVGNIADNQLLDDMQSPLGLKAPKGCLPGTRKSVLEEIVNWIIQPPEEKKPNVYWLHGVAGCGKSAIASTITEQFRSVKRCASFFFDASKHHEAMPERLFSTLSRSLADLDSRWKKSLVDVARESWGLRKTLDVKAQFENFILRPAKDFRPVGPILVVIDALDESGPKKRRSQLLEMLGRLDELKDSGHFRFLITSRLEDDIQKVFGNKPWVLSCDLSEASASTTDDDIRCYVDSELSGIEALGRNFEGKPWLDLFVDRAGHLFQWASVACKFVKDKNFDPVDRFIYLRDHPISLRLDSLDNLYTTVLRQLIGTEEQSVEVKRFRTVLGRILSLREPLSLQALAELWPDGEQKRHLRQIVRPFGSLLQGVDTNDEPIHPLHASFIEFLLDPQRSRYFHVKPASESMTLAVSSLREMNKLLRFNICCLESSFHLNHEVEDLPFRIKKNISEHLSYACRYFASHLNLCAHDPTMLSTTKSLVQKFLYEKFFNWLEILSLLGEVAQASAELLALKTWTEKWDTANESATLITDAERFIRTFSKMMTMSAPHIYLSSLAFVPSSSPIFQIYSPKYPGGLRVDQNYIEAVEWMAELQKLPEDRFEGGTTAVNISPDGHRIISGVSDTHFEVWDADTSQTLVSGPSKNQQSPPCKGIEAIAISSDGKRLAIGYQDHNVAVFDAYTGDLLHGPLMHHQDAVVQIAFSRNDKLIFSVGVERDILVWDSSADLLVWDSSTGKLLEKYRMRFGGWGLHAHLGFWVGDDEIRVISTKHRNNGHNKDDEPNTTIVNARSSRWQPIVDPFRGPETFETRYNSADFSRDGNYVVVGCGAALWIWDLTRPDKLVAGPLDGHYFEITAVKLSHDCKLIASGAGDFTVRLWDACTGESVAGPFYHNRSITSLAFSFDNRRVISGSWDKTLRVWDTSPRKPTNIWSFDNALSLLEVLPYGDRVISAYGGWNGGCDIQDAYTGRDIIHLPSPMNHSSKSNEIIFATPNGDQGPKSKRPERFSLYKNINHPCAYRGQSEWIVKLGHSPGGKYVASETWTGCIRVYETNKAKRVCHRLMYRYDDVPGSISAMAVSSNGRQLACGMHNGTNWIVNLKDGVILAGPMIEDDNTGKIRSIAYSPNGSFIVSGSTQGSSRVWDARTGEIFAGPFQHTGPGPDRAVESVSFSRDSQRIVSGSLDRSIRVWDIYEKTCVFYQNKAHADGITAVRFSFDDRYIVSGSKDKLVRVWNLKTGQEIGNGLGGQNDPQSRITSVAFSSDNKRVIACSNGISVRAWQLSDIEKPWMDQLGLSPPSQRLFAEATSTEDPEVVRSIEAQIVDGWLCQPKLCWIPRAYQAGLLRPSGISVTSGDRTVRLDFSRLKVGKDWVECCRESIQTATMDEESNIQTTS